MQSLLQVEDKKIDAEEVHPQLHHSENQAGASSLQRDDSRISHLSAVILHLLGSQSWQAMSRGTQVGLKTRKPAEVAAAASSAAGWTGACLCSQALSAAHKAIRSTSTHTKSC